MPVILVDLAFAGVMAAVGAAWGWWLRGCGGSNGNQAAEEKRYAREALGRLHDLAARVAADVGEHSSRVEEINEELTATGLPDAEAVLSAVDKLVEANSQMHEQLESAEERLQEQARQIQSHATEARTDALTKLANRRALDDLTARCFAEFQKTGKTFSVVMFDVDHFKKFNDTHGHQAGDDVLRGVGGILRRKTPSPGLAARYGGEEFTVILPGVPVTDAVEDAERVRRAIDGARFQFGEAELHVTVSSGVSQLRSGEDAVTAFKRADTALYASKQTGRNRTHWHDGEHCHPVVRDEDEPKAEAEPEKIEQDAIAPEPATPPTPTTPAAEVPPPETAREEPLPVEAAEASPAPAEGQGGQCDSDTFCTVLNNRVAEWRRGGSAPSVLLVHVDRFDSLVSSHGDQAGKRILATTMQFLRAAIREMDLVAHYEDTTFSLLLPGAGLGNAVRIAERLRQAIARCTLPIGGDRVQFTVSVGGAEATSGDDTQKMLDRAQEAMHAAVKSGGNCSYFHNGQWSETVKATLEKVLAS